MTRCDYDVVFYRVFCVTLLAVAFTFTVILTNVFVDIDGLLTNRRKYVQETTIVPESSVNDEENMLDERKEIISDEDKNYDSEINPSYRTKRSIELETIYHSKNPAIKKMLTRRLASLLEELDDQEPKKEIIEEVTTLKAAATTKNGNNQHLNIKNEDLLHLAMHNILLQGLIGHMDLNDVYKKIHELVQTFNKHIGNNNASDEKLNTLKSVIDSKEILRNIPNLIKHNSYDEEHKFLDEIIKCKDLEEQITKTALSNETNAKRNDEPPNLKDDKVFIKTVIEINEKDDSAKASNKSHPHENIEGLIKLIYNGKSVKIKEMNDEIKSYSERKNLHKIEKNLVLNKDKFSDESKYLKLNKSRKHQPTPLLNKVLEEYLKQHSLPNNELLRNSAEVENIKTQRLKRQIKIRYSDNVTLPKTKALQKDVNKDEDDLYIEIETHFDGKSIKGEKKKKLVRNLIDKIQKAVHSDIEEKHDSVEHIKFVKRTQDPIYRQDTVSHSKEKHLEPIEHRLLNPIGKTLEYHENIANKFGDTWKKQYLGPNFLSPSKAVNSAEINEVSVNYDSILRNGIPKRLQAPLNTEIKEGTGYLNPNSGNVTLFLKDIDGSGFSIGFNQYEGEPPDKDSMKMFNGIENLIREYHKTYDEDDNDNLNNQSPVNKDNNFEETYHQMAKRNVKGLHKVYRRSITEVGTNYYNANEFKIFFKENSSLNNYQNIITLPNYKLKLHKRKENVNNFFHDLKNNDIHFLFANLSSKKIPTVIHEKKFNKKLKASELLSVANLFNRKKRSVNVKKISNLKSKIKLNRYLNTNAMANKKVFIKNNRNKRHVNNIRIIAREPAKVLQKNSDENIFFISKENSYANKATMIKAIDTVDTKINTKIPEYSDDESSFSNIYRIQNPKVQTELTENIYNAALSHSNEMMSKYPHIFMDKSSNSKEEIYFDIDPYKMNNIPYRIEASPSPAIGKHEIGRTTENSLATVLQDLSIPKVEEMLGAMMSPMPGSNYRITVKMSPKNKTNTNAGFKEFHTSVNKSYDNNGLRYYTLLNVSEISKIEKLNRTDITKDLMQPLSKHLLDQENQIKALLKLHKKRVDLQVNSLLRESNHLKKMIESHNKDYNIDKTIKLLTNDENYIDTTTEQKTMSSISTTPTTSEPLLPSTTEAEKVDKSKIFDTIRQNEKVTSEILSKIDTNTQILQTFLQKISSKLDFQNNEFTTAKATEKPALEMKLDLSQDWKSYGMNKDTFFVPNEPKNGSIPFVYAYQQSIPMKSKVSPQSLASLVYHGHIHTNGVQNIDNNNLKNPVPKIEPNVLVNTGNSKRKLNESKFFLNEINNFKVSPSKDHVISANIKINTTRIKN